MKYHVKLVILFSLLAAAFLQYCKKNERPPVSTCTGIRPHDGLIKCRGKLIHPTLGTIYYNNQFREFTTIAPDKQCYTPGITDSNGNLLFSGIPYAFQVIYSLRDSSVTTGGHCGGAMVGVLINKPEKNWYDSCNGILYLDYYWTNGGQWYTCDTCYFK